MTINLNQMGYAGEIEQAPLSLPEADKLEWGNNPEIEARWDGVVDASRHGGSLAQQHAEGVWRALGGIGRLFDAVTAGSNEPESAWWRFLKGKGIRRGKRRGKHLLFYPLVEHLTNEYASQDERNKSTISRRAAVLQHWHDKERTNVPADGLFEWIASHHGVKAIAEIANPPKPPLTKEERKAARVDRKEWFRRLTEREPVASVGWDALPDNLRALADGTYRLALVRVCETEANGGVIDIIGVDDGAVSQAWLEQKAQGIVQGPQRATAAYRDSEEEPTAVEGDAEEGTHSSMSE